ncbi:MAG: hypothetical protein CL678_11365 [Bdellovibrionaceae bacterium]|nr:hypothetical protein [Pseudobdellovibrionaceae bacterium]|tara:strand:+ start:1630 stop:2604 length:975 start_codon:yes stop_codon:yes gene_type:complete
MSQSLLLLSTLPEDQKFAAEVAATAGLTLHSVTTPKEASEFIATDQATVIMADASNEAIYKAFEDEIQNSIGLFSDKINANAIHFISSEDIHRVDYIIGSPLFGHFIYRNYGDPSAAGKHYGRVVKASLQESAFGLELLMPEGSKIQTISFRKTTQKAEAVEAVKKYLLAARFKSRMAAVVANAVDELLMNAMFDAPVDEIGRQILASTPRDTEFDLVDKHQVQMKVGYDGKYVGVTAIDYFGSLDKVKLMSHISKIYRDQEYRVRTSVAGAGIGLASVFRSGASFFFVSESKERTEVTVFFKRTDNFKEFKEQFRFISTQFYF